MRHRVAGKKLSRTSSHRKALAKNLMRAMIIEWQGKGHIVTTRSKAKFIQPRVEKLISLARDKSVHNIRRAMSIIGDRKLVQLLFDEIGPYYKERPGGYTRVLRMVKPRLGDASVRAYLGYVREDDEYPEGDRRIVDDSSRAEQEDAVATAEVTDDTPEPTDEEPQAAAESVDQEDAPAEADESETAEEPQEADAPAEQEDAPAEADDSETAEEAVADEPEPAAEESPEADDPAEPEDPPVEADGSEDAPAEEDSAAKGDKNPE